MLVDTDDEVEVTQKFKREDPRRITGLPWYIIDQDSTIGLVRSTTVELLTLVQMFITPLALVDENFRAKVQYLQLTFDIIWMIGIALRFCTASAQHRTLSAIVKQYFKSGLFFIDFLSTAPAMITREQKPAMTFFRFLRLVRFSAMFTPFRRLMAFAMPWKSSFQITDAFELLLIFSAVVLIAHMSACVWIFLGHI